LKIPTRLSEDTKGVVRRYQRGYQKIPKGLSEDNKGVIRRYQSGCQKIPKGLSEDTKGVIKGVVRRVTRSRKSKDRQLNDQIERRNEKHMMDKAV
jgi:hypothetical protein